MLYTFLDALPAEGEGEVGQLAGMTDLGREEIMCTIRERFTYVHQRQKGGVLDHSLVGGDVGRHSGRGTRNGRNGAGGGRGCGRGGKDYRSKSRKHHYSASKCNRRGALEIRRLEAAAMLEMWEEDTLQIREGRRGTEDVAAGWE